MKTIEYKDKENNVFTIYTLEKGGPIVSDVSLDVAREKFRNALQLSIAVRKVLDNGLEYCDKERDAVLFGALDDCLMSDNYYIPIDYKTRGFPPKEGDSERYYQTQIDTYALLLNENGYKVKDFAYLIYYYPEEVREDGIVKFNIKPVRISTDLERAKKTFENAVDFLKGPIPKEHSNCEYCCWINDRLGFE